MDSRIRVLPANEPTPTLTAKQAKGSADGILLLIDYGEDSLLHNASGGQQRNEE